MDCSVKNKDNKLLSIHHAFLIILFLLYIAHIFIVDPQDYFLPSLPSRFICFIFHSYKILLNPRGTVSPVIT